MRGGTIIRNKEDVLDRIKDLSACLSCARVDVDALSASYLSRSNQASYVREDADVAIAELKNLAEMIESDEIELDDDVLRTLSHLFDSRDDVIDHMERLGDLLDEADEMPRALLNEYAFTQQDVIRLARELQ